MCFHVLDYILTHGSQDSQKVFEYKKTLDTFKWWTDRVDRVPDHVD